VDFEPVNPAVVGFAAERVGDFDKEDGFHDFSFQG
jgi:hypothetical protein